MSKNKILHSNKQKVTKIYWYIARQTDLQEDTLVITGSFAKVDSRNC